MKTIIILTLLVAATILFIGCIPTYSITQYSGGKEVGKYNVHGKIWYDDETPNSIKFFQGDSILTIHGDYTIVEVAPWNLPKKDTVALRDTLN